MAVTRIGVLGPLHISIDGKRVPPGAPMQCAVLGRLVAAGGRVVPTDRLIDDLWHGAPPVKAVAALQVYIHNLRRVFEPERPRRARSRVIVSESHGYALNLEPEHVDAWQFERLLHGHEAAMRDPAGRPDPLEQCRVLDAALSCWHGAAFEAFSGMPWAAQEAARLAALRLTAAELRAQAALEMNRPAEVVLALRPVFEEYPGREECARLLALAQYRLGQSLDALVTVRRSREFLTHEYGVDPGPGLRDLETAILTHSVENDTPSVPAFVRTSPPVPAPAPEPLPDNGYGPQRAAVLAAADAAAAGHVRLIWLAGEAGAGKTTLAAAVTAHLAERGWTTVFGRCPEVEGAPPAWAWAEVLTGLDAADPETFTDADAFTLARRVVKSCRERSADTPIAVVLEDVHGADTATLQVLRQVVNWLRDQPILIVATLRGTESGPGVRDTAGALALFTADRIELDGLDLPGTRRAAADAGLTEIDDRTLELLRLRTGGNPLFIRELAKLVASQGTTDALPDSVRDLLGHRVAQLPAEVVELLRHLSVWGEESEVNILAAATGLPADTVIDLVATAESARLLRTERTGRMTFDHALVRETVYYEIPLLRRARMHWAAFELLRTSTLPAAHARSAEPGTDTVCETGHGVWAAGAPGAVSAAVRELPVPDTGPMSESGGAGWSGDVPGLDAAVVPSLSEPVSDGAPGSETPPGPGFQVPRGRDLDALAHHAALGADGETAPLALVFVRAAARRCVERRMRADAVSRWRSVLSLHELAGHTAPGATRADQVAVLGARCELVTALAYDGQHIAARTARREALEQAESLGGTELLAHAAISWPTPLIWSVQDWHTADPRIREPLRIAMADPELPAPTRVRLLVTSVFDRAIEDPFGSGQDAAAATALAESLDDPDLLCTAVNAQAFAAFAGAGFLRAGELETFAARLLRVSTEAGLTEFRALAHYLLFRATLADADLAAAADHAASAGVYATDGQLGHLRDAIAPFGMVLELLRGNIDEVLRLLAGARESAAVLLDGAPESIDPQALHIGVAVSIGLLRDDMSPYLDELRDRAAVNPELFVFGYALALVHSGFPDEARRVLADAPPLAPHFWCTFTAVRARLAVALGDLPAAQERYDELLPYAGTVGGLETGATVLGPIDFVLADLAAALGEPERALAHRADGERLRERLSEDVDKLEQVTNGLLEPSKLGPAGQSRLVRRD
ncbi:BTAD domain-containing putative transcriptional regulator [Nocardia jejuensis]|uniref:BTAD domain-containing putative transcriptional regulator n=1 Tax=Nocardia jejuensis TaxID=328049 RepID=UPI00082D7B97|nr:BTAD domain-containing putative transcriptional regulator [Nocardia jejuensis]